MKKMLAFILALMMVLTSISAFADTIYTKVSIDGDAVKKLVTEVPDDQLAMIDPIIALVNTLGVKVVTAADGAQVDLDLNGANALSLGFAMDEAGATVASTLFPNYLITVSQDTINQFIEQFMANMPGAGDEGGMDMNAITEVFGRYFQKWFEACAGAGQPGEPETGEFEIDGFLFDTKVPVTVDMPAILEATRTLMDDLMADPAAIASLKGMAQGMAQSTGETSDEANFEAEFKVGFEEWISNMPEAATAEFYASTKDSDIFYLAGDAFFQGKDEPSCHYQMMQKGDGIGYMGYWDYRMNMIIGFEYSDAGFNADFTLGEMYFGLGLLIEQGDATTVTVNVYVMSYEAPLATIKIDITAGGERTLSLDAEGKTVLAVEDVMSDQTGAASQGLLGDIMMNGMGGLMGTLTEQVPEISALMTMMNNPGTSETEETQQEADPSSWKTLGDVRSLETQDSEATWDDEKYVYIFSYAGTKWMVTAAFSKELEDAIRNVDFMADDREEQIDAILAPCEIISVIDLATLAISQEELDQWIGKTGQALLDAGWEYNGYTYDNDALGINMINGRIEYLVSFEGGIEAPASYDEEPDYKDAVIAGIRFRGNSYHFFDEEYADGESSEGASIANPWVDSTSSDIAEAIGATFGIPNGAEGISYSLMPEEGLAEMRFTLDGMDYVARIMPAEEFTDISGLYYEWDAESAGEFAGMECLEQRAFTDEGTIDLFQWFDKDMGLMYSLSTSGADLDGFDITAIAGAIYAQAEEAE